MVLSGPVGTTFEQDSTEEGLSCPQCDQHFFQSSLLLKSDVLGTLSNRCRLEQILSRRNDFDQQAEVVTVRGVLA